MAIINPKATIELVKIKINIDSQVLAEIEQYCAYAKFSKPDEFFEASAKHILSKDKAFKTWREKANKDQ